jgi:hypothetical protein
MGQGKEEKAAVMKNNKIIWFDAGFILKKGDMRNAYIELCTARAHLFPGYNP